jgi:phenylalanyl-tRNA synthetase beta chain
MLVPLSWLREYVTFDLDAAALAERLTVSGLEVESIKHVGAWWDVQKIVVAQVAAVERHPDADRLVVVRLQTGAGGEAAQIVTGSPGMVKLAGQPVPKGTMVAYARPGAQVIDTSPGAAEDAKKEVKSVKLRGVESAGVLCSDRELGISDDHSDVKVFATDAAPGTPLRDVFSDDILEVAILPDAARCLSMAGMAREVAALTGGQLKLPTPGKLTRVQSSPLVRVEIPDATLAPRYIATVVRDVKIGPSPAWMQDRLRKMGLSPINNVVDITNYVMLEYGNPLHAFDYHILRGRAKGEAPTIAARPSRAGERIMTLDGTERPLEAGTLVIADAAGPVAVAGVMGGRDSEIRPDTRDVLLEAASFQPAVVRRGAQRLKMATDSSYRFTRGVPPEAAEVATWRAVELLKELAGGTVVDGSVDVYPSPRKPDVVFTTTREIKRQLGVELGEEEIQQSLRRLDIQTEAGPASKWTAELSANPPLGVRVETDDRVIRCVAPWYRLDVRLPADVTEEVARMIGFDRIPTTLMDEQLPRTLPDRDHALQELVRDVLIGAGLQETIAYSLTNQAAHEALGLAKAGDSTPYVTLANPLHSERVVMRRSLLVSAIETVLYNARFTDRWASFELGRVYLPEQGDGARPLEEERISLLLTGSLRPRSVHEPTPESFDFFDLKGVVELLARKCGVDEQDVKFSPRPPAAGAEDTFTARAADVIIRGTPAGVIGELNPLVQARVSLKGGSVYLGELTLASLAVPQQALGERTLTVNRLQPVIEDLAFVVEQRVLNADVERVIREAGGPLLAKVELFDVFRGEPLAADKKSLAYRLTYQGDAAPPTADEVAKLRNAIVAKVQAAVGGTVRAG